MMAIAETASAIEFLDREYLTSLRQFPEGTQQLLLRGSSMTVVRTKDLLRNRLALRYPTIYRRSWSFWAATCATLGSINWTCRKRISTEFTGHSLAKESPFPAHRTNFAIQ